MEINNHLGYLLRLSRNAISPGEAPELKYYSIATYD